MTHHNPFVFNFRSVAEVYEETGLMTGRLKIVVR